MANPVSAKFPASDSLKYQNDKYEFSVELPKGFVACVDEIITNGVGIILDDGVGCGDDVAPRLPDVPGFYTEHSGAEETDERNRDDHGGNPTLIPMREDEPSR